VRRINCIATGAIGIIMIKLVPRIRPGLWAALVLAGCCLSSSAQDIPIDGQKYTQFPHPLQRRSITSIGITATTMPYEITEELHYRIPAVDVHLLRRISRHWHADFRAGIQGLQNHFTVGPHWSKKISHRTSLSLGNDIGYWFAFLNVEGFRTHANGWQNYPSATIGYRFNKRILVSFRAEAMMTLDINTFAGDIPVTHNYQLFSGSSYTLALEQPFYGHKSLTLGFRAIYTKFFWQTWSAFSNFDRDFFYPQLIVGLIL